jgi:uncharacterized protein YcfJ
MRILPLATASFAAIALCACTSTGNTERGALGGAALGAAAGAIIGNNTGSGDAATGAAIGAVVGGAGGAYAGSQKDKTQNNNYERGPNGEPLLYDKQANRYYYIDAHSGRSYWVNGDYRG